MSEVLADNGKYRIVAEPDCDVENPRAFCDHLGTMVYSHRNYILGDKEAKHTGSYGSWIEWFQYEVIAPEGSFELPDGLPEGDENGEYSDDDYDTAYYTYQERLIKERDRDIIWLPLYIYDHSGVSMSTSHGYPFNDRWDAGQVGWIYAWHDDAIKWGFAEETWREQTENVLIAEVSVFDGWLRGDYYCLRLEQDLGEHEYCDWETIDSICGIEGDYIKQAVVDYFGAEYKELAEMI